MSDPTTIRIDRDPGEEAASGADPMALADRGWRIRQTDPGRAAEIVREISAMAAASGDDLLDAIATVVTLGGPRPGIGNEEIVEQSGRLLERVAADPHWKARMLDIAGIASGWLGRYESAMELMQQALEIRRALGDEESIAGSMVNIGNLALGHADLSTALEYSLQALAILERIEAPAGIARALGNIGIIHNRLGNRPDALEYFMRSMARFEECGDRAGVARSLNNIGVAYHELNDYAVALEHYLQALAIREQLDDRQGMATSTGNIGVIHYALGDYAAAQEYYERELALRRQIGDVTGEARVTCHIGNCMNALGEHAQALDYHERALEIQRRSDDRFGQERTLLGIAGVRRAQGLLSDALGCYNEALAIQREIGDRDSEAETLVQSGGLLVLLDQPQRGIETINEGLALAMAIGARATAALAHRELVAAYEKSGEHRSALESLREHYRIRQEIQTEELRQRLHQSETRRQVSEARKEAEIERLRNVELAAALEQLEAAHDALKRTQTQLVQSEKMASLGQLTAGIAHEINNPINFVRANISPLRRDLKELGEIYHAALDTLSPLERERFLRRLDESDRAEIAAEIEQLLDGIEEGARRTAEIVAGLRTFSRLDEEELKPVDLHAGLDSTLVLLGPKLKERITVRKEYGDLPAVECHAGQINQVFMNILSNAIDAIDGEGEIRITTSVDGESASVAVADNGSGIASEILERIFDPFFTTKDVGSGTGLGLAICDGIVRQHGGRIDVRTSIGQGTTFTLLLPLSPLQQAGTA